MGKNQHSLGQFWDMKFMLHCSLFLFSFGALATLSFYRYGYVTSERISNIIRNTHTNMQVSNSVVNDTNIRVLDDNQREVKVSSECRDKERVSALVDYTGRVKVSSSVEHKRRVKVASSLVDRCDLFSGRWVYDNTSRYPLYKDFECPYMHGDLACETYGRKDLKYQKWRWQPHGCNLPRFDGKAVLERLRGKRVLFVGDSVNRNQWVSMVCMLQSSIPDGLKSVDLSGLNSSLYTFKATEYNASIDYYWAPMLMESNGDNPSHHSVLGRQIRSNSIEKHAKHWLNADILVFNSYLWWIASKVKILQSGSFDSSDQVYEELDRWSSYEMALEAWSKWLHTHIDPSKTKLFFMSMTSTHMYGQEWGEKGKSCYGQTEPVMKYGFQESGSEPKMMKILESKLSKLKAEGVNVQLMNITQLTQYRKDGHPSIYKRRWHAISEEQRKHPSSYADCSHWCLPGVPDVWNEILYAYFLR